MTASISPSSRPSPSGSASRDRVAFSSGAADKVSGVYEECDALLFPVKWREPWGLVGLEAMAAGRPVVASRAGGGAAEYLEPERNCLGFTPGQAAELAAAVTRLAVETELRARLVAAGRVTAGRFTRECLPRRARAPPRASGGPGGAGVTTAASRPAVSVVIPFAGSDAELEAVLSRLGGLVVGPGDEILLADNGPGAERAVVFADRCTPDRRRRSAGSRLCP